MCQVSNYKKKSDYPLSKYSNFLQAKFPKVEGYVSWRSNVMFQNCHWHNLFFFIKKKKQSSYSFIEWNIISFVVDLMQNSQRNLLNNSTFKDKK